MEPTQLSAMRHLYVHVPFCARRCSYCDFSIAVRRFTPVDDYLRGIALELAEIGKRESGIGNRNTDSSSASRPVPSPGADSQTPLADGRDRFPIPDSRFPARPRAEPSLTTLYLGGGTPSRLGGEGIARLLELVTRYFPLAPDAEVTIEVNPDDVKERRLVAWRDAGVNRLSIGSQSFDPRVLAWMHRTHDPADISRAVRLAREAGFENLSLDLIFATPVELERDWDRDVAMAIELEPSHLSLYGLTFEAGTPLARWQARGETTEAPEERFETEFLSAHAALAAAGYEHYEVSNYARPGARSRHNSAYWSRAPYLGLGPSAHSFDGEARWWNYSAYAEWLMRLDQTGDHVEEREVLTEEQADAERMYLGLRTADGIAIPSGAESVVERWRAEGWAEIEGGRVRLTPRGWLRLDALAAALTPVASRS